MDVKRAFLSVILFLIVLSGGPASNSQTEPKPEWKYVATSEDDNQVWETFYDAKGARRTDDRTIQVWLKQVPIVKTEKERQRIVNSIIRNRELNRMSVSGYEKFAYSLTLLEFDCNKTLGRAISIKDYAESEKPLSSQTLPGGIPFSPVAEGSMVRIVFDAVCK